MGGVRLGQSRCRGVSVVGFGVGLDGVGVFGLGGVALLLSSCRDGDGVQSIRRSGLRCDHARSASFVGKVERAEYRSPAYEGDDSPAPANTPGIRHILFAVDAIEASLDALRAHGGELVGELVNYEDSYWLCYVRGPARTIVELAEKIS